MPSRNSVSSPAQRPHDRLPAVLRRMGLLWGCLHVAFCSDAQSKLRYDNWRLEWSEEFTEPGDSSGLMNHWRFDYPWGRNLAAGPETEYYTGKQLRIARGQLFFLAQRLATPRPYRGRQLAYESGMLFSTYAAATDSLRAPSCANAGDGFTYGLFEIRCRQPRDAGSFPAFWLYGTADEIDIFEATADQFSNNAIVRAGGFWRAGKESSDSRPCYFYNTDPRHNLHSAFHTYGLAWQPGELIFYFDGHPIRRETQNIPIGCPMALIANLAVWNWAAPETDTLAIDYIRVYRPRTVTYPSVVQRPGGVGPTWDLAWLPFSEEPGRPDPAFRQHWYATPDSGRRLRLALLENLNPPSGSHFALPHDSAAAWSPPWVMQYGSPALRVSFSRSGPVEWTLRDPLDGIVLDGSLPAGTEWRPSWPSLLPGFYRLWLRQGAYETVQSVVVLGRPVRSAPDSTWQRPSFRPD